MAETTQIQLEDLLAVVREKKRKLSEEKTEISKKLEDTESEESAIIREQFSKVAREVKLWKVFLCNAKDSKTNANLSHAFPSRSSARAFLKEVGEVGTCIEEDDLGDSDLADFAKAGRLHFC